MSEYCFCNFFSISQWQLIRRAADYGHIKTSSKNIFIALNPIFDKEKFTSLFNVFMKVGVLNAIGVTRELEVLSFNPFFDHVSVNPDEPFPDKLENLNKYKMNLVVISTSL